MGADSVRLAVTSFFVLSLLLVTGSTLVAAQEPQLSAGLKSGANVSWITGSDWREGLVDSLQGSNAPRFGPTVGGFVSVLFPSGFGGRVELLFTEHGGRIKDVLDSDSEFDARFSLLDVSILVERRFPLGVGEISIYLGPTLFLVQGDLVIESQFGSESAEERDVPEEDQFFAASGGVGYQFSLGPGDLLFDARYSRGITGYNGEDAYDNAATLMVGYSFPF